jgi:uncharacterized protein YuzE
MSSTFPYKRHRKYKRYARYDEESDTLSISFAPGEHATGIELTDHILLRINTQERRVVGITLLDYSVIAQPTEMGPRSFPLVGLERMQKDIRDIVLDILRQSPVQDILTISTYTPNLIETTPIIAIQSLPLATSAS